VKTTHLLKVLHLSLPDNLLQKQDAILIANMIEKNPPLRILNLHGNCFDYQCGKLFGAALFKNDQLKSLDLSTNRLGDQGVQNLLFPLLEDGLKDKGKLSRVNIAGVRALADAAQKKSHF